MNYNYPLDQLYTDQDPDLVQDSVAALVSWLDPNDESRHHAFTLREQSAAGSVDHGLIVSWDLAKLTTRDPGLPSDVRRFRQKKTVYIEDQPKVAAYGLAFVAISCLLHRRVVAMNVWNPPDLQFDAIPGAIRGVEVAGRGTQGYAAFKQALDGTDATKKTPAKKGKRARLLESHSVVEAYVSLWCRKPLVSVWEKVKP